jgi:hypothetical protein
MFISSLLREQLRLALGVLLALALTVGLLPVAFVVFPDLASLHLLGMPLSWLVLGMLVYPLLVLLGWIYIRRAERNERDFAELLSEAGPGQPARGADPEDAGP